MDYREWPAPDALRRHVQCVWRLTHAAPAAGIQTIYPDGRCELIAHLATPPRCRNSAGWHEQARELFAAQRVSAVQLQRSGPLDCVGVRLQPAASALAAGRSLPALCDEIVDLATLDAPFARVLRAASQCFAAGHPAALWRLLERRCAGMRLDERIETAARRIEESGGTARIDSLPRAAALSMRGFQARFRAGVGLAPKEFARVQRLQATLRALDRDNAPLAMLASDAGFADQAHATREVQRVTGLTPARLRARLRQDRDGDVAVRLAAAFVRGHAR
jgi:methylphosphotriester-DNA--protein-cysteine methyltransferase